MTGQPDSQKIEERLQTLDKELKDYLAKLGITEHSSVNSAELQLYMTLERGELNQMSPEDCGEIAVRLSQVAFFIQKEMSKLNAIADWAENSIQRIIAPVISQYDQYTPAVTKRFLAIKDNTVATRLQQIKDEYTKKATAIAFLAQRIQFTAETLLSLQGSKRLNK
jgi:hypothetical protein